VVFKIEISTFVLNLTAIQYAIFVSAGLPQEIVLRHLSARGGNSDRRPERVILILYTRCQKNTIKVSYRESNWKEYCLLNGGFYLYKTTMIVFLTLDIPLYWRINKGRLTTVKNTTS